MFSGPLGDKLKGQPDTYITAGLILVALFLILIAFFGNPLLKIGVLAWAVAP